MTDQQVTRESREIFLKVILGSFDCLLSRKGTDQDLSAKTCSDILHTLFQSWLKSHTFNDELWQLFIKAIKGWRHRAQTIFQWNATCLGLLNHVNRLLYGHLEGHAEVYIKSDITTVISLEPKFSCYAWIRVLHLLGNLEELENPDIYNTALDGILNLVKCFLAVGTQNRHLKKAPDGNTIFHILGPFLFEAINSYSQSQSE